MGYRIPSTEGDFAFAVSVSCENAKAAPAAARAAAISAMRELSCMEYIVMASAALSNTPYMRRRTSTRPADHVKLG